MARRIVQASAICHLLLCIITYFTISYQFDKQWDLSLMLASTSIGATLLRLSIYVIPGVHLIGGLFGLTFTNKGILKLAGVLLILASIFTIVFSYENRFMLTVGIVSLILSVLFLAFALLTKHK